jgi:hypothetical protein
MLRLKGLLLAAFCLSGAFARADALRLVAPAKGATLRGGSFAELRWSASRLPPSAEEWEAFLSIDGGKYYAFRVTPHLDIDLQHFTFVVPNVDTRDARILIRTGNEVNETRFESRGSFSIVRDAKAEEIVPSVMRLGRGEAARDGDSAVIAWADGSRNGDSVTQQSSPAAPTPSVERTTTVTREAPALMAPALNSAIVASVESAPLTYRHRHASRTERLSIPADLLLVCSRRNV